MTGSPVLEVGDDPIADLGELEPTEPAPTGPPVAGADHSMSGPGIVGAAASCRVAVDSALRRIAEADFEAVPVTVARSCGLWEP